MTAMRGDNLLVYVGDKIVGRLEPVRDGARFRYEPSFAASHAGEAFNRVARAGRTV